MTIQEAQDLLARHAQLKADLVSLTNAIAWQDAHGSSVALCYWTEPGRFERGRNWSGCTKR